jgi:hypothetical protein
MASPGYTFSYHKPAIGVRFLAKYAAQVPLEIKGTASQTGKLLDCKNSSASSVASISAAGLGTFTGLTATGTVDLSGATVTLPSNLTLFTASVALTAAQTKLLHTTPITLVAAPASGKVLVVESIIAKNVFGTQAYAGGNALEFRYTDGSGVKVSGDIAAAFINLAAATRIDVAIPAAMAIAVSAAPIVVAVPVADPTAGDGIITITVLYRVVTP